MTAKKLSCYLIIYRKINLPIYDCFIIINDINQIICVACKDPADFYRTKLSRAEYTVKYFVKECEYCNFLMNMAKAVYI